MGRDVSDTRTMRWEIRYIHRQSGFTLFLDMLRRRVSGGCLSLYSSKNLPTDYLPLCNLCVHQP